MPDIAALLQQLPYFAPLAPDRMRALAREVKIRRYRAGEPILAEGKPCSGLGFVLAGQVKVFKRGEQGREQILRLLGPGRSFNDVPVFDGGPTPGNVTAVTSAEIGLLAKGRLLALVEDEPTVALAVIRLLATRLRAMTIMVEDLALRGVTARLARLLLECSRGHPPLGESGTEVCLLLTQERLAAMTGSVRAVVQRSLKALEREGALEIRRGHVNILEPSILALWAGAATSDRPDAARELAELRLKP